MNKIIDTPFVKVVGLIIAIASLGLNVYQFIEKKEYKKLVDFQLQQKISRIINLEQDVREANARISVYRLSTEQQEGIIKEALKKEQDYIKQSKESENKINELLIKLKYEKPIIPSLPDDEHLRIFLEWSKDIK